MWTWISFCFTFFAFGVVLFIYESLAEPSGRCADGPGAGRFGPLTDSQRKIGKYFLVVAVVLLLQIARRHDHGARLLRPAQLLRHRPARHPAVQLPARRAHPGADHLDRRGWIGAGLFLAPAIAGGREARGQGFLVDLLFWVTLVIVAGALIGNWLGIMGYIDQGWFWFGNQGLSYIQLGRFWQIGFFAGLLIWSVLMFRALWPTGGHAVAGDPAVLVRPHPARTPDLGRDDQHRGPLCLRHDPADRDREVVHASPTSGAGGWCICGSSSRSSSSPRA